MATLNNGQGLPFLQTSNPQNGGALAHVVGLPDHSPGAHNTPHFIAKSRITTDERERLKRLERENWELRRANEMAGSLFFATELDGRRKT